jgi:Stage II sporulation protein E (SpoIIE)
MHADEPHLLNVGVRHSIAADLQALFRVPFVVDVIRRVCEQKVRCCARHQPGHVVAIGRIANEQFVGPEDPKIADGRLREFRHGVFIYQSFRHVLSGEQAGSLSNPVRLRSKSASWISWSSRAKSSSSQSAQVTDRFTMSRKALTCAADHSSQRFTGTSAMTRLRESNLPVGLMRNAEYRRTGFRLNCGDRLILVTDGVEKAISLARSGWNSSFL